MVCFHKAFWVDCRSQVCWVGCRSESGVKLQLECERPCLFSSNCQNSRVVLKQKSHVRLSFEKACLHRQMAWRPSEPEWRGRRNLGRQLTGLCVWRNLSAAERDVHMQINTVADINWKVKGEGNWRGKKMSSVWVWESRGVLNTDGCAGLEIHGEMGAGENGTGDLSTGTKARKTGGKGQILREGKSREIKDRRNGSRDKR